MIITYDGLNRLTKTTLNTTTPLEISYTYQLSERNEGSEDYYRTTKVRTESIGAATYRYSYDDMGNITKQEELVNGVYVIKYTYQYDSLNQLVYEKDHTENVQHTYAYDEGGNLDYEIITQLSPSGIGIGAETINYGYGDNSWKDKMTSYDGQSITYDAIGNPISYRDGMSMTWENGRQLQSLTQGGTTISYTYDAGGVRMSKTVNGEKWTYQYAGGKLLHESRGEKEFAYFYDANGFLSAIKYKLTPTGTEKTYYAAHNWRGDVTGLYNASGKLVASYEYDSWGNVTSIKGLSGSEVTSETHIGNLNKIRYRGYYQDTETGLYYLMTRYYDPVTHRFLNADGYFQTGTGVLDTNMSAYCANNPVNFLDPTGQYRVCPTHGSFYSQPNCVGCRPDFQQALDRYSQIMAKRKKVQVSVGTKTETSSSAPWWTPISSYSGSIQGTITHSSSENSKYYLEHLTISTGRNETTTGYALDIESFHYQNYSSEGRLGGKVGWSDETTVNSIGLISGNGKLNIEWDTTVTNGTSYVTNYSGYSISPTMGIAVAVIVAAVITAGPAGATQIIHDLSPA